MRARACAAVAFALVGCSPDRASLSPSGGAPDAAPPAIDATADAAPVVRRAVKVMIVNMASIEGTAFIMDLALTQSVPVMGVPSGSALCNPNDVCEVTLGMGYANAATSMAAIVFRSGNTLDLTHTYFVIAGTAGIDPLQGTVGSAAWAQYLVDYGISSEIDAREMPAGWPYGYLGLGAPAPDGAPTVSYGTELFELNAGLVQKAYALSKGATLDDSAMAKTFRANYPSAPANLPPTVLQCDVASSDTWLGGAALSQRARDWVKLQTAGKGTFCTSANEDNATYEVLRRGAAAGLVDRSRVAVLRAGSDMTAPYPGMTDADCLESFLSQGGLEPAVNNLDKAASPLIEAIVNGWSVWQAGVPQ